MATGTVYSSGESERLSETRDSRLAGLLTFTPRVCALCFFCVCLFSFEFCALRDLLRVARAPSSPRRKLVFLFFFTRKGILFGYPVCGAQRKQGQKQKHKKEHFFAARSRSLVSRSCSGCSSSSYSRLRFFAGSPPIFHVPFLLSCC